MALSCCAAQIPASHSLSTEYSSLPKLLLHHSRSPPLAFHSFPGKFYNKNNSSWYNLNNLACDSGLEKWRANISFFPAIFNNKAKDAKILKEELLKAIAPLDRGVEATPEDQQIVDEIARKLEAVTPIKEPLKSDLLNGKWELMYTTYLYIYSTKGETEVLKIPVKAPGRAQGELEITYLDEELRISRGDKGNLFILKMVDPSYRVPAKKD